jgi:hypothetical protein
MPLEIKFSERKILGDTSNRSIEEGKERRTLWTERTACAKVWLLDRAGHIQTDGYTHGWGQEFLLEG